MISSGHARGVKEDMPICLPKPLSGQHDTLTHPRVRREASTHIAIQPRLPEGTANQSGEARVSV